ncbi:hypothetical protein RJT34_11458 [Clitoria ternatea]|uniref:DNA2/NAM7 helicase helicase domain-containing protein n=1 Tax=Clitoria ternatea TaxID=43366 RepID=A0AAN9JJZ3_CLITE
MIKCKHNDTKLIWGPPGTGKTKTVSCLLFALLRLKIRTLACAPTNTAVLQVAVPLHGLVKDSLGYDTYGLGDMVLFGNRSRMKVDSYPGLRDVFLDYRVKQLIKCFAPLTGWTHCLESMIKLLEDPGKQYSLYKQEKGIMSLECFAMLSNDVVLHAFRAYKDCQENDDCITLEDYVKENWKDL